MDDISAIDFKRVLHALPYPAMVHTLDVIVYANLEACRILDAGTPEALIGLPVSAISHADTKAAGAERRRIVIENGADVSVDLKLLTLEGRICHAHAWANPVRCDQTDYIAVVARVDHYSDRVEAPSAETRLPVEVEDCLYESVVRALVHPVFVYDDTQILFANTAAQRLFKTEEDLAGRPMKSVGHADGMAASEQRTRVVLETGQTVLGAPVKLVASDGSPIQARANVAWVDLGDRVAAVGVLVP